MQCLQVLVHVEVLLLGSAALLVLHRAVERTEALNLYLLRLQQHLDKAATELLQHAEIVNLLWDVLSDQLDDKQKMNKIDNILRKIREGGMIVNETIGNKSVWSLVKE